MSEKHTNMVVRAKINLMKNPTASWLMSLLLGCRVELTNATPCGHPIDTLAIDASTLYINGDYFESLDLNLRESALLHEALHLGLKHVFRYVDFPDSLKFNKACDYIVNDFLVRLGFKVKDTWLYNINYRNWSLKAIYDDLPDTPQNDPSEGEFGKCMFRPVNPSEAPELQARVYAAETILAKDPGTLSRISAAFADFQYQNTNPLPFKEIMGEYLNEINRDDRSWRRPNRRMFAAGMLAKGYDIGSLRSAVVAFDASGSMTEEQENICIEQIEFMRDVLNISEIHLLVFDDKIQNAIKIDQYTPITNFDLKGGGGTDLNPVIDYIEDNHISPEVFIIFTDMGLHIPSKKPEYPTIWIGINPSDYWVQYITNSPEFFGKYAELKT